MNIQVGFTLCFTGDRNQANKVDFTGAFLPEIRAFMSRHGIDAKKNHLMVALDSNEARRRKSVIDFIAKRCSEERKAPNTLVFACHGFTNRIELGFRSSHLNDFAKMLRDLHVQYGNPNESQLTVILYCCSTGSGPGEGGDNGFADRFRDALCINGFVHCRVIGSESAGHTTMNSRKRIFEGMGSPVGGTGGVWIVQPGTPLFSKWRKALTATNTKLPHARNFRYEFPFMSIADIHKWLLANIT
jgi:hypothetical protein